MTTNPFTSTSGEALKFEAPGDSHAVMVTEWKMLDDQFNPGQQIPVIAGKLRDGTETTLWCSKKALLGAIGRAMQEAGHTGTPEPGSILTITRLEDGVAKTAGHNNPHLFEATYVRPTTAPAAEAHPFEAPTPAPAPAPAAAPVADAADFFAA
jgi:hypothetical protein